MSNARTADLAELLSQMSPEQLDEFIQRLLEAGLLPPSPYPASPVGDPEREGETCREG